MDADDRGPDDTPLDAVVLGAGASGLSLVCHLAASGWTRGRRIVLMDDGRRPVEARSWAFWADEPRLVDTAVSRVYQQVRIAAAEQDATLPLAPYRYSVVRGADLAALARRLAPDVMWVRAHVDEVRDGHRAATVLADGRPWPARWVFDSTAAPEPSGDPAALRVAFTGWDVETTDDVFAPDTVTLFDFRTPQRAEARFVYVLPTGPRRGLVELTRFTTSPGSPPGSSPASSDGSDLREYLSTVLYCNVFRIVRTESGVLTLATPPPRSGWSTTKPPMRQVLRIGAPAGRVKPSTGYAFDRIQRHSAAIASSLLRTGHPFDTPPGPRRFGWLDRVFDAAVARDPAVLERAFAGLVRSGSMPALLRFLDEDSTVRDDARLVMHLPRAPFLRAALTA